MVLDFLLRKISYTLYHIQKRSDACSELKCLASGLPRRLRTFVCSRCYSSRKIYKYTKKIDLYFLTTTYLNAAWEISIGNSTSLIPIHSHCSFVSHQKTNYMVFVRYSWNFTIGFIIDRFIELRTILCWSNCSG